MIREWYRNLPPSARSNFRRVSVNTRLSSDIRIISPISDTILYRRYISSTPIDTKYMMDLPRKLEMSRKPSIFPEAECPPIPPKLTSVNNQKELVLEQRPHRHQMKNIKIVRITITADSTVSPRIEYLYEPWWIRTNPKISPRTSDNGKQIFLKI